MKHILVTGAGGQIGTELVLALREKYGTDRVIATDIKLLEDNDALLEGPCERVDVTNGTMLFEAARKHHADTVIHLAALLSATAERNPQRAWELNMGGLMNALEVSKILGCQFFTPSSIGAFGPDAPKVRTPQVTVQRPVTMYGINKVAGELLCQYYFAKYGLDARGLRFPGLISSFAPPGGGTTDYAVEMYFAAVRSGEYVSSIAAGTFLDMMYMPDAIEAIIALMEADPAKLVHRNAYNVSAMSADPEMFAASIRRTLPSFRLYYQVDPVRQGIADSWPDSLDTTAAEAEWNFRPRYSLEAMTDDMLARIGIGPSGSGSPGDRRPLS